MNMRGKLGITTKGAQSFNLDIMSETNKKDIDLEISNNFLHLYSGVSKDQQATRGVLVLIKKIYKNLVTKWDVIKENIIKVNLTVHNIKTTIIVVNVPSDDVRK